MCQLWMCSVCRTQGSGLLSTHRKLRCMIQMEGGFASSAPEALQPSVRGQCKQKFNTLKDKPVHTNLICYMCIKAVKWAKSLQLFAVYSSASIQPFLLHPFLSHHLHSLVFDCPPDLLPGSSDFKARKWILTFSGKCEQQINLTESKERKQEE